MCTELVRSFYARRKRKIINIPWQQQINQPVDDHNDDFSMVMILFVRARIVHTHEYDSHVPFASCKSISMLWLFHSLGSVVAVAAVAENTH